ncbi:MAG: polysaccharide biosynthesis protein [Candidatus Woesebacteria bacterium]|nr:MAG: polysaccharide biosynthesis protein [Candidatus Woesebacteria bacterium]
MSKLLITGGTGSFGNAVTKHFLKDKKISEIIIFSRDEKKQHDMFHYFNSPKLSYIIGDVRDKDSITKACREVDFIFHAAALKQVPTGEFFPLEIVKTNILGTENVFSAAEENKVKKVVLLSSDKAVYPINAMGMSKALAEKLVGSHARNSKDTVFCAVRYGNVMATRGSVIPLFIDQIKQKKALLVTHPLMTRFLLSLDDSIRLVELAIKKGNQGDLFIKKAPAATIGDLAHAILNIFNVKNKIKIIGIRAGEKIHETLATQAEIACAQDLGGYFRISTTKSSKYEEFYEKGVVNKFNHDYTSENTKRLIVPEIEKLLLSLDYIKKELNE